MPLSKVDSVILAHKGGMTYKELEAFTGPDDHLNKLIEWKAGSIKSLKQYRLHTITEGAHMQRQFSIELRVDFADAEKLIPLQQTLQQAARHALATARLISDNPKSTQVAIYSEDFFSGHQQISLLDDVIQQGLDATGEETSGSDTISSELMGAVDGSQ